MKKRLIYLLSTFVLFALNTSHLKAEINSESLQLNTAMNQSILKADEKHTAYIRVGLTGLSIENPSDRAPLNIAIVIDKSGSMSGDKMHKALDAAIMAIDKLSSKDIVSIIAYDSTVQVIVPATKVSDKDFIFNQIRQISASGNTALFAGVSKGAHEMRKFLAENMVNRLVLLSDGLANVGPSSTSELGKLGSSLVKEGISVTTIGLGMGYNEDLMTQLAFNSDGSHYFAEQASDLARVFEDEFGRALSVVAQEIHAEIKCHPGIRPIRVLGRDAEITGQHVRVFINHLYDQDEKYVLLEVEIPAGRDNQSQKIADITVDYDNLKANSRNKRQSQVRIMYSKNSQKVENSISRDVMINVIEQIAVERNKRALKLRDAGQIAPAKKILIENKQFLYESGGTYNSPALIGYSQAQEEDAQNIDGEDWDRQRKVMRKEQFQRSTQQKSKSSIKKRKSKK